LNEPGRNDDFKRRYREFDEEQHRVRDEQRDLKHSIERARDQLRAAEWALGQLR
jgi:predicted  nucleic acid-binding Zn-ribbon protein